MDQTEQPKSNRAIYILVTIVVLLLAGAAVFALQNSQPDAVDNESNQTESTTTKPVGSVSETKPVSNENMVTIAYTDNGFEPKDVTVKKGTIVTIINKSSKPVQFSSDDHPVHKDNTEMNLQTIDPVQSASYTATQTGTWGFHDHIDDSKTGTVTVTE